MRDTKRDSIIRAATRLFLKHGFADTTMDAIAKEAKVTKQTIYSHFINKDALFCDMVLMQCQKHRPSDAMLHDERLSLEDVLFRFGMGFLDMISSKEGLATHRLVLSEAERRPKLAEIFYETGPLKMNELLEEYLQRQTTRGTLQVRNPASAASYFFAMLKGRYHLRMALKIKPIPTREEIAAHVKETVEVFLRLYGGDNPLDTRVVMT